MSFTTGLWGRVLTEIEFRAIISLSGNNFNYFHEFLISIFLKIGIGGLGSLLLFCLRDCPNVVRCLRCIAWKLGFKATGARRFYLAGCMNVE